MDQILQDAYHEYGYPSSSKLLKILKKNDVVISKKQVDDFVTEQDINQRYRKKSKKTFTPITTIDTAFDMQMDLLDFSKFSHANGGMKWILIVIDVFSRRAYARAIKSKEPSVVEPALDEILVEINVVPATIRSDNGNEFKGDVDELLEKEHIVHQTNLVGDHHVLGIVDRFSQTIKNILYKWMDDQNRTDWSSHLDNVIKTYNKTPHSGLGEMTPIEAEKYPSDTRNYQYENRIQKAKPKKETIHVGDTVRAFIARNVMNNRSFHPVWTREKYKVIRKEGGNYVLDNGKKYKANTLQKTRDIPDIPDDEQKYAPDLDGKEDVENELERDMRNAIINRRLQQAGMDQNDIQPRTSMRSWKPTYYNRLNL